MHNDYGDGAISHAFFDGNIPPEQKSAATETRRILADARIESYNDIKHGINSTPEQARIASNLAVSGVTLQWLHGDASRAERSFHTINTEQTPIGDLEVRLIRDRRCSNAIATRALVGAGTGRYSPSSFSDDTKAAIKKIAKDIYDELFVPPLQTPIKTLDLPVAGRGYFADTVKLVLDFVEFVNRPRTEPAPGESIKRPRKIRGKKLTSRPDNA